MSEQDNVQAVQGLYAAFGRGDINTILNGVAEDVEWWVSGPEDVPHFGMWRGREGVGQFFTAISETLEPQDFQPREFIAQGDNVVATGSLRFRVKETGRVYDHDWIMVWTLRDGKVTRYRQWEDTAAVAAAFRG